MEALAHLALMAKAKLVFENAETFLSFPALSPISYKAENLNFCASDLSNSQDLRMLSEFSRMVNSLPGGTIFQQQADHYLWDIYRDILNKALIAEGTGDSTADIEYENARLLLTVSDSNGLLADSPAKIAYNTYRDAWFKVNEDYKTQQSTATVTTDAKVCTQWNDIDEPRLRALVLQAEADWETKGFKAAVERAMQVERSHDARSPRSTWSKWVALFDPSIDLTTDLSQQEFALTSFSPSNAFDEEWPTFRMTAAEIQTVANQAPQRLKDLFVSDPSAMTIDSLSFEYRSVTITRAWFRPALFDARFWKLPDDGGALSDGDDPPTGLWPAYVTAVVFVRNICIKERSGNSPSASPLPQVRALPALTLSQVAKHQIIPKPVMVKPAVARPAPPIARNPPSGQTLVLRAQPQQISAASAVALREANLNRALRLRATAFPSAAGAVRVTRAVPSPVAHPSTPAPAPDPNLPLEHRADDVSVLAFICKRLPRCPNPDPSLTW